MNATNNHIDDEEEKPLDPAVERIRRRMLRLQLISAGIMMIGLLAVIMAIVFKVSNRKEETAVAGAVGGASLPVSAGVSYTGKIDIPDGASVTGSSINGNQVLLQVLLSNGASQLWLYDVQSARVFGKIDVE